MKKSDYELRIEELGNYFRWLTKRSNIPQRHFLILGQYRSGTTLLVSLLNSHPDIHCGHEILLPQNAKVLLSPKYFIKGQAARYNKKVYGFKVMWPQLKRQRLINPEKLLHDLYEEGWKFIYLKRLNIFHQTISHLVASARGQWHYHADDLSERPLVTIDCDRLLKRMSWNEVLYREETAVTQNLPHLPLVYEQNLLHAENHQQTAKHIFQFLGLQSVPVKTDFVKVSPRHLSDIIQNYEEVIDFVRETKYAHYLDH